MVKKLFKHEFLALLRLMLPIECAVLGVSILVRFMTLFENDSVIFESVTASAVLMMVVALVAGNVSALIFGVMRYYKNLFSVEGYLSFTLPVTATQHITVKAITATIFEVIATVVAVIAFCIATAGDLLVEVYDLVAYALKRAVEEAGGLHIGLYILEFLIICVLSLLCRYLLFYSCISIGQTAKKHRILLAFGVYGIYMIISSFISTFFNIAVLIENNFFVKIGEFLNEHAILGIHITMLILMAICAILIVVFFLISNIVIRKKLNLE